MFLNNIKIGTLYAFLRDIKPYVDNIHVIHEYNSKIDKYRLRVILNEWKVDELVLISRCYAPCKYIYELMHDICLLYNFKINRHEKDRFC